MFQIQIQIVSYYSFIVVRAQHICGNIQARQIFINHLDAAFCQIKSVLMIVLDPCFIFHRQHIFFNYSVEMLPFLCVTTRWQYEQTIQK